MLESLTRKKVRPREQPEEPEAPVLNEDDEAFLQRIAEEGPPPPLPARNPPLPPRPLDLPVVGEAEGNNMQLIPVEDAQQVPLPNAPDTPLRSSSPIEQEISSKEEERSASKSAKKSKRWNFLRRDSRDSKRRSQRATATDLMSAAQSIKLPDAQPNEDGTVSDEEAKREEDEMATVLEQLNLAAVDNRVFSISKESQELLHK